jgi:hypothetical protein
MAVSVDRVYQTVLALANKEQRGYITPQEFNLFANHAQNEIFEQYFYDLNQFLRAPVGNKTVSSDLRDIVEEKISLFRVADAASGDYLPISLYKLEAVRYGEAATGISRAAEEVTKKEYDTYHAAALTKPPVNRPIFYRAGNTVYGSPVGGYNSTRIDYIRKPTPPNWTYVIVNNKALWNPAGSDMRHFELHASEEKNLAVKILALSGVAIKDLTLAQAGAGKEAAYLQQEKA